MGPSLQLAAKALGVIMPESAVGTQGVVLLDPGGDHDPGFEQAVELFAVEELVAHAAVEALDEGVLLRSALLDECRLHALVGQPLAQASGDELASVIGAQQLRATVALEELLERF